MEEDTIVNGSHEVETDPSEILKLRKPKNSHVILTDLNSVIQNGNSEPSSDITENNDIENGHIEETSKLNGNENVIEENLQELKESTPRKLQGESRKESTPKPETPMKRELRRRETTPRASTPKKNVASILPQEKHNEELKPETKDDRKTNMEKPKIDDGKIKSQESNIADESVIMVEEVISTNENVEVIESQEAEQSTSIYSVFTKSYKSNFYSDMKDSIEASTFLPSTVCQDSPSYNNISLPSNEIKGRKPINSFSKFPGRTVEILSLDSPTKRKAYDSFDDTKKKKFAGDFESGSEKSPGWSFFSSSWSPVQASKQPLSSTPFHKRAEQDSMAVNYDKSTNSSFAASDVKKEEKWPCSIM